MTEIVACNDPEVWNDYVIEGKGHPLQLWGWGAVKEAYHWKANRLMVERDGKRIGVAQMLVRPLPGPFKALAYIPRGPVCEPEERGEVLEMLALHAKHTFGAILLSIEPDWEEMPEGQGWRKATNTVLLARTLILDLSRTEDELLSHMSKKTRQYIRKSEKEATVRQVKNRDELEQCMDIYRLTAARANFPIHDDDYYYAIFDQMGEYSPVFAAFSEGKPVAFLWLAISSETAFELYGGMNDEGQRLRANYILKWHTIQTMKKWGIHRYDMNGLLNDGVSTFKQGFADHEDMLAGTYDKPLSPLYFVWNKALPFIKKVVRTLKRR